MTRSFDRTKDCVNCRREIDEITVKLKKITIGPDTYRRYDDEFLKSTKYEKLCLDCYEGKPVQISGEGNNADKH